MCLIYKLLTVTAAALVGHAKSANRHLKYRRTGSYCRHSTYRPNRVWLLAKCSAPWQTRRYHHPNPQRGLHLPNHQIPSQSTIRYERIFVFDSGFTPFLVTRFRVLLCFLQQVSSKERATVHVAYDEPFVSSIDSHHSSECSDQALRSFILYKGDGMCMYGCRVTTSTSRVASKSAHGLSRVIT